MTYTPEQVIEIVNFAFVYRRVMENAADLERDLKQNLVSTWSANTLEKTLAEFKQFSPEIVSATPVNMKGLEYMIALSRERYPSDS